MKIKRYLFIKMDNFEDNIDDVLSLEIEGNNIQYAITKCNNEEESSIEIFETFESLQEDALDKINTYDHLLNIIEYILPCFDSYKIKYNKLRIIEKDLNTILCHFNFTSSDDDRKTYNILYEEFKAIKEKLQLSIEKYKN